MMMALTVALNWALYFFQWPLGYGHFALGCWIERRCFAICSSYIPVSWLDTGTELGTVSVHYSDGPHHASHVY